MGRGETKEVKSSTKGEMNQDAVRKWETGDGVSDQETRRHTSPRRQVWRGGAKNCDATCVDLHVGGREEMNSSSGGVWDGRAGLSLSHAPPPEKAHDGPAAPRKTSQRKRRRREKTSEEAMKGIGRGVESLSLV